MPKIRALKPDFWTDESVVSVQPLARLLFQGLWNYSCDNGHVEDKPRQIKMRILPADDCDVDAMLDELASVALIERSDGVITVGTLGEHNRLDKRFFTTCDLAECTNPYRSDNPVHPASPPGVPAESPQSARSGHDDDGDGDGDSDGDRKDLVPRKRGTRLKDDWTPAEHTRQQMAQECPRIDLRAEHRKFVDYWTSKAGRDAVKIDWDKTWRNWIRNAKPANGHSFTPAPAYVSPKDPDREDLPWLKSQP